VVLVVEVARLGDGKVSGVIGEKASANIVRISRENNRNPSIQLLHLIHTIFDNNTRARHANSKSKHGHGLCAPECSTVLCLPLILIWQNSTVQTVIIPNTLITPIACRHHLQIITSLVTSILNASPPLSTLSKFYTPPKFALFYTPFSFITVKTTTSCKEAR
jgi:hypothetical protein